MVKLTNNKIQFRHFVLFLTFWLATSCVAKKDYVTKIEAEQRGVSTSLVSNPEIDSVIHPYRTKIDKDLSTVLAYAPVTLDKFQGQWQTTIGNLLADVMLAKSKSLVRDNYLQKVDLCLLNHGGIRAPIPQGDVTTRTAFEVMPFENSLIVISLVGDQIIEIADYIIKEKKPHPLAGMTFEIIDNKAANIQVGGQPLDASKVYHVVTSDYLANGGDNMVFFKKSVQSTDLDLKIRDVLIEYFRQVDTIPVNTEVRIKNLSN